MIHGAEEQKGRGFYAPTDLSGLAELWAYGQGSPNVTIALLDGPADLSHPCFRGADISVLARTDDDASPAPLAAAHGTHVASVIFGQPGGPLVGIAPRCRGLIVPIFSFHDDGVVLPCPQIDLARAITRAVENGADIINISGGQLAAAGEAEHFLVDAVGLCARRGVLLVAAAGNDGCECIHIPAALGTALAVGAMDRDGLPVDFSNWGERYRAQGILAPGVDIVGALPGGGTVARTGTSFAAPVVSGIAGLLMSLPTTPTDKSATGVIRSALLESAHACDPKMSDDCARHLAGTLDVAAAQGRVEERARRDNESNHPPAPANRRGRMTETITPQGSADLQPPVAEVRTDLQPEQLIPATTADSSLGPSEATIQDVPQSGPPVTAVPGLDSLSPSDIGPIAPPTPPQAKQTVQPSHILPSACCSGCEAAEPPQKVYALGYIGYDFGIEARMDSLTLDMSNGSDPTHPMDQPAFLAYLEQHPDRAASVIWTLNIDLTPVYAIHPFGPYARETFDMLRGCLAAQVNEGAERVSIPGVVSGQVRLMNNMVVPVIIPELRGMFCWSTDRLIGQLTEDAKKGEDPGVDGLDNFMRRIYEELRNLGTTAEERAINYAATNVYMAGAVFANARRKKLDLHQFEVVRSPICRPDSDCWDVKFTFFEPAKRIERSPEIFLITVDVSDLVPVMVGPVRHWTSF